MKVRVVGEEVREIRREKLCVLKEEVVSIIRILKFLKGFLRLVKLGINGGVWI